MLLGYCRCCDISDQALQLLPISVTDLVGNLKQGCLAENDYAFLMSRLQLGSEFYGDELARRYTDVDRYTARSCHACIAL